jgi:hypothetical protein
MNEELQKLSLFGRMMRIHVLTVTPILYNKPPIRWGLIFALFIIVIVLLGKLV